MGLRLKFEYDFLPVLRYLFESGLNSSYVLQVTEHKPVHDAILHHHLHIFRKEVTLFKRRYPYGVRVFTRTGGGGKWLIFLCSCHS